jgi:hypothetical protein
MATITLRSVKGSPLTNNEVDTNFTNLNTDKYQSGDSIVAADLTASGDFSVTGETKLGTTSGVTAAGTTQGDATALTKTFHVVTNATAAQGVKLPAAETGKVVTVLNDTLVSIKLWPESGDQIDGGSVDAARDLGPGMTLRLVAISGVKWNSLSDTLIFNSSGTRIN